MVSMNWLLVNDRTHSAADLLRATQEMKASLDTILDIYGSLIKTEVTNTGFMGVILREEFSDSSGTVSLVYSYASSPGIKDTLFLAIFSLVVDWKKTRMRYDLACTGAGLYAWWQTRAEAQEACAWPPGMKPSGRTPPDSGNGLEYQKTG